MRFRVLACLLLPAVLACRASGPPSGPSEAPALVEDLPPWTCSSRVELSTLWRHVRERHDLDRDGEVTREEYSRGEARFANYDRNEDGVLDASDFPTDTHFNGFNHMIVGEADVDEDGAVTLEEWADFTAQIDADGDGRVVQAEVAEMLGFWASDWRLFLLSFDQDGDGDFDRSDLEVTFRDQDFDGDGVLRDRELRGWSITFDDEGPEAPAAGDPAPDFRLTYAETPGRSFHLGSRVGEGGRGRPLALLFGSYT